MINKYRLSTALFGMMTFSLSHAGQWCANCYWKNPHCPSITTQQIVSTHAYNENANVNIQDKGPFTQFYCDNQRTELGVLWTEDQCSKTGGLTLTNDNDYADIDKAKCTFGKDSSQK